MPWWPTSTGHSDPARASAVAVEALELAVVDLDQPLVDPDGRARRACDRLCGVGGAAQRARPDGVDAHVGKALSHEPGLLAAGVGERDVCLTRVDVVRRALGLTVAHDEKPPRAGPAPRIHLNGPRIPSAARPSAAPRSRR